MEHFPALVSSLGEHAVSYIGQDHLRALMVKGDNVTGSAIVSIELRDDSWAEQSRAIDKMIELREMFLDELSIEYSFVTVDVAGDVDAGEPSNFSYA